MKQYRILLAFLALFPMIIYYIALSFSPQFMATHFIWGVPYSILGGVVVMLWGAFIALFYALLYFLNRDLQIKDDR